MNTDKKRITLLADRLCYLDKGIDGLRWRTGMRQAGIGYRDRYDVKAESLADTVLRPIIPATPILPGEARQLSLLDLLGAA